MPLIDWSSTCPGNRGVNRMGHYELYDAPVGLRITIEEAQKVGPILATDREGDGCGSLVPLCVWRDAERYHLLYSSHPRVTGYPGLGSGHYLCYATSEDGYNSTRPHLGQVEWKGSTTNNIIVNGPTGIPFEDLQAPPEERFKAIGQVGANFDPATEERLNPQEAYNRWRRQEYEGPAYKGPRMTSRHWVEG